MLHTQKIRLIIFVPLVWHILRFPTVPGTAKYLFKTGAKVQSLSTLILEYRLAEWCMWNNWMLERQSSNPVERAINSVINRSATSGLKISKTSHPKYTKHWNPLIAIQTGFVIPSFFHW